MTDIANDTGSAVQKTNRIHDESSLCTAKEFSAADPPPTVKQTDRTGPEPSSSRETHATDETYSCQSNDSAVDSSGSNAMDVKIAEFLKWDIKGPSPKQLQKSQRCGSTTYLAAYKGERRLVSGLDDDETQDSRDNNVNIRRKNSYRVCWNETVTCYQYPLESSRSTIELRSTDKFDTGKAFRSKSQSSLLDDYLKKSSDLYVRHKNSKDILTGTKEDENSISTLSGPQSKSSRNCHNGRFNWLEEDSSTNQFKDVFNLKTTKSEPHNCNKNQITRKQFVSNNSTEKQLENTSNVTKPPVTSINKTKSNIILNTSKSHSAIRTKDPNAYYKKLKSKINKKKCDTCGEIHNYENKTNDDNILLNMSEETKQKHALRKLLGLNPEEKNVLVMIRL